RRGRPWEIDYRSTRLSVNAVASETGRRSERDIVVEILARRPGRPSGRACLLLRAGRCTGARAAAQHLHLVRDDLGGPAVVTVPILPFAGTETPLDVHLRALSQVLGGDLRQAPEHGDRMPFR